MLYQSNSVLPSRKQLVLSKKTKTRIIALVALVIGITTVFHCNYVSAVSAYEEAGFGDADLYECVINQYNSAFSVTKTVDDVLTDSELASMKVLKCQYGNTITSELNRITSTEGIQKMTGLEEIRLSGTLFPSIDLSAITNLKSLIIEYNSALTSLDISHNTNLEELRLIHLIHLDGDYDFSAFPKMRRISFNSINITSLNTDNNPLLETLSVWSSNQITEIRTDKNPELKSLSIAYMPSITSIDLSKNTELTNLTILSIPITSIDLSKNTKLGSILLSVSSITSLDVKNNKKLTDLIIHDSRISEIDLSENPLLSSLDIGDTSINTVDIRKNPKIYRLRVPAETLIIASVEGWYDEDGTLVAELWNHARFIAEAEESNKYRYEESTKRLYIPNPIGKEISLNIMVNSKPFGNNYPDEPATLRLEIHVPGSPDAPDTPDAPGSQDEPSSEEESDIQVPDTGSFTADHNGTIIAVSLASILTVSTTIYVSRYIIKRRQSKVSFK